jgi:hypothetical protein
MLHTRLAAGLAHKYWTRLHKLAGDKTIVDEVNGLVDRHLIDGGLGGGVIHHLE